MPPAEETSVDIIAPRGADAVLDFLKTKFVDGVEKLQDKLTEGPKFKGYISTFKALYKAYDATHKLINSKKSDPGMLKVYQGVTQRMAELTTSMNERFREVANLVAHNAFNNEVKIPCETVWDALMFYYNNPDDKNKDNFIDISVKEGLSVAILSRIRDQLPAILLTIKDRKSEAFHQWVNLIDIAVFELACINYEYLLLRWSDQKYEERNHQVVLEMITTIYDIYELLGLKERLPEPLKDSEMKKIVEQSISTATNGDVISVILKNLKEKEQYQEYNWLVVAYEGYWHKCTGDDDGATTWTNDFRSKTREYYVIHRFNVTLPRTSIRAASGTSLANKWFSGQTSTESHCEWRTVANKIAEGTGHVAIHYEKWSTDTFNYHIRYVADDAAKNSFIVLEKDLDDGAVVSGEHILRKITTIATFV